MSRICRTALRAEPGAAPPPGTLPGCPPEDLAGLEPTIAINVTGEIFPPTLAGGTMGCAQAAKSFGSVSRRRSASAGKARPARSKPRRKRFTRHRGPLFRTFISMQASKFWPSNVPEMQTVALVLSGIAANRAAKSCRLPSSVDSRRRWAG